jgi:hypothetical protein
MFNMKPTIQPQPEAAQYPIDKIYLFPRLTRATYRELFGEEAPPYDPAKIIKRWGDSTKLVDADGAPLPDPAMEITAYSVWDEKRGAIVKRTMTNADAAAVNLPGTMVYPKWNNPSETVAKVVDADSATQINGSVLISKEDAQYLMTEITKDTGMTGVMVESDIQEGGNYKVVWGSETRRQYGLKVGGLDIMSLAALGTERWAAGFGCKGKWQLNGAGYPKFVADVVTDGMQDPRPEFPFPVRALLPNEKLVMGWGNIPRIERTDMGAEAPGGVTNNVGGGLTAAQASQLTQISQTTKTILALISE